MRCSPELVADSGLFAEPAAFVCEHLPVVLFILPEYAQTVT